MQTLASATGCTKAMDFALLWFDCRFDADADWPTDLDFDLLINPNLRSYDGLSLDNKSALPLRQSFMLLALIPLLGSCRAGSEIRVRFRTIS